MHYIVNKNGVFMSATNEVDTTMLVDCTLFNSLTDMISHASEAQSIEHHKGSEVQFKLVNNKWIYTAGRDIWDVVDANNSIEDTISNYSV